MTALNFPDSPSNGDTYQEYTYNSTKGTWAKPAEQDARTAVYANIAALPTSGTAGDMAYVTATNRLYIWTGTGWYNIALINNTPTISGVNASYALAIDGTATTVTITAADPEGLPITYSIVSDTSGNTATVTQGTGASTNVFTITPSTNTAHAGTFSLTFRASDGVNIASAAASFTLVFNVQNQKYTTALITSVGANNAVNTSFDDKSTSNHAINAEGDATQTTFSPHRHGGYSVKMDGGDRYTLSSSADWNLGSSWTIEGWFRPTATPTETCRIFMFGVNGGANAMGIGLGSNMNWTGGGAFANGGMFSGGSVATLNEWQHVAWVRDGSANTATIYLNGQAGTTYSSPAVQGSGNVALYIGYDTVGTVAYQYRGNIANLRITKSAVYTSNFTPPERFTASNALTNTKLLAFHTPYVQDESGNNHSMTTVTGDPKIVPEGFEDKPEYSAATHGGSARFDGNGDYLMAPSGTVSSQNNSADFNFSSGAWTWEAWIYPSSLTSPASPHVFTSRYNGTYRSSFYYNSSASQLTYWSNGSARISGPALKTNQWYHVALSSDGTTTTMWVNGKSSGTTTHMQSNYDQTMYVGAAVGSGVESAGYWNGNITDARVVKGTAVYTAEFTPPTAPLTAITNTKLLVQSTDAGIIDKSQSQTTGILYGNAKSSTTQSKYLTSSISLAAAGDYIQFPSNQNFGLGTGDFTLEAWVYWTGGAFSGGNGAGIIAMRDAAIASSTILFINRSNGNVRVYDGPANTSYEGTAISQNTWHHVAVTRQGTTWRIFKDGTQGNTWTSSSDLGSSRQMFIGRLVNGTDYNFVGYISDARVTKGLARYTANFTPPTAALRG